MAINSVSHPAAAVPSPPALVPKPEPVNADGSAIPDEILYHHRPEDIGDHTNQDVPGETESNSSFFGSDGLTFGDVLDVINPLQHIPVVSTLYRAITGDEISPGARVAGGALFGGPVGFAVATANALVEAATGEDIGDTVLAAFFSDEDDTVPEGEQQVAAAAPAIAVSDADPATVGAGALPISLLPPKPQPPVANALAPANAMPVLRQTTKLPFGGMGTMSAVPNQASEKDPVAALLQARAAVPMAGPIQGLGNGVRARPVLQAPLPSISPLLADKLSALAVQNAAPKSSSGEDGDENSGTVVPAALMPQRMLDTLDRYERMKSTATGKS
jgi:hypothetical protein